MAGRIVCLSAMLISQMSTIHHLSPVLNKYGRMDLAVVCSQLLDRKSATSMTMSHSTIHL